MEIQQQNLHVTSSSQRVDFHSLENDNMHPNQSSQQIHGSQKQSSPHKSQTQHGVPLESGEGMKGSDSQKSNRNPLSSIFRNEEVNQAIQNDHNQRKYSQSFRSVGIRNGFFQNPHIQQTFTVVPIKQISQYQNNQYLINQPVILHKSFDQTAQHHKQPLSIFKKSAISNRFSNRSQGSHRSNRSDDSRQSNSSYRYNRFIDTMQVPQLTSLQVVKNGRETRVQRRSSLSSHHSRSASTCKKSYDDIGDIHMQKIDQSACQELDQKSVKRSIINPTKPKSVIMNENLHQQFELQQQLSLNNSHSQMLLKQTPEQFIFSKYIKSQQEKSQFKNRLNFNAERSNQQFSSFNDPSIKIENHFNSNNFKQTICHQVSFKYGEGRQILQDQFDNKSIQVDNISQISIRTTQSAKMRQQNQRKIVQRQIKIQKLSLISSYNIRIETGLQKDQRLQKLLQYCKQFVVNSHHSSNFGRSQFKDKLLRHFQVFGTQLNPIDDVGQMLSHDGLFAKSYIMYVKGSRNNSGMIQSMLYSHFQQQIQILTNRQIFSKQYRRVKQERQMHYQNQFEKRIKQYEQKQSKKQAQRLNDLEAKIASMQEKISQSQKKIILNDKKVDTKDLQKTQSKKQVNKSPNVSIHHSYEPNSQSNISVAGSNETVTVQDINEISQISVRKSATIEILKPNQSIPEKDQDLNIDFQEFQKITQTLLVRESKKQQIPKKVQKSKKRYTKKKQNKKSQNKVILKEQQKSQDIQQTISQVQQISKEKVSKHDNHKQHQTEGQSFKQIKGILKSTRQLKDEQNQRKKPSNRLSREKYQKAQLSSDSKNHRINISPKETPKSSKKEQQKSRNKKQMKISTDIDETDSSEQYKVLEKSKKNQNRIVKFTNSTKGGESPYMSRMKNQSRKSQNQDKNKQEIVEEKRKTRSRSKK